MTALGVLLKPEWRRLVGAFSMLIFLAAAYIQAYAFVDDVPGVTKPPLYDLLRPFDFWAPAMLLILPMALLYTPLQWLGLSPMSIPLVWPLQAIYLYLLACLLVFGHDRWGARLESKWRWLIMALPLFIVAALWSPSILAIMSADINSLLKGVPFLASSIFFSSCVLSAYVYIMVCVAVGIYKGLIKPA